MNIRVEKFKKESFDNFTLDHAIEKIKNNIFFSYSRFNDGELICGIKTLSKRYELTSIHNCDNHMYFPDLGKKLIQSLNKSDCKNYYIQYMSGQIDRPKFSGYTEFLINNNLLKGRYVSVDFLQFNLRNKPEKLKSFVDLLNNKNILIVGPKYLRNIKFLKFKNFVEIPTINCFLQKDSIIKNIENLVKDGDLILFSASMTTNYLIDELYPKYGNKNFMIDIGSLWDIFFYKTNPEIKQRTPNLNKLNEFKNFYKNYFSE